MRRLAEPGGDLPGTIKTDTVVPPGGPWSGTLARGERLRIVDLEGRQGVDFLCYNAARTEERYHAPNTIKASGTLRLGVGHVLYSDVARPMFTIAADSCGYHDTIAGCCSAPSNAMLYGAQDAPGCRENFLTLLARHGMGRTDIVPNINFFCAVPVFDEGRLAETVFTDAPSRAGDYVELRAEMGCLALISNCPQVNNPCSGGAPSAIRVVTWQPDGE